MKYPLQVTCHIPSYFHHLMRRVLNAVPASFRTARFPSRAGLSCALVVLFAFALAACNQPTGDTTPTSSSLLQTMVAATLTQAVQETAASTPVPSATQPSPASATPSQAPSATPTATITPTPTPTRPAANLSGKVCYLSQPIPPMTAYFENTQDKKVVELPIAEGQSTYEVLLPPGTYQAYVWLPDFSRGGLYSKAVPCGMKSSCQDHTILPFTVEEDKQLQGIDLCDWYAGPFNVPYPPGKEPEQVSGSISGTIAYPSGSPPTLNVFAFNQGTGYWYYVQTNPGASRFTIPNLPPGIYQVVAYDETGDAGGYAGAGHSLIDITVKSGENVTGVEINDWNAPAGAFPPDPIK